MASPSETFLLNTGITQATKPSTAKKLNAKND